MKLVKMATILCAVVVLGGLPALAGITPIIGGRFDPDEGYTQFHLVKLEVQGCEKSDNVPADDGVLWLYYEHEPVPTDLYVNFTQPLTLIDNTYGVNAIGWGKNIAPSGKNHNFKDLKGSDKTQFTITDGMGIVVFDFTLDYISESRDVPSGFESLGGDGKAHTGPADSLLEWGTSLDYNFNSLGYVLTKNSPATDEDYTGNPDFPGWVFDVTYEFQLDRSLFADNGFGGLTVPIVHGSPKQNCQKQGVPHDYS